MNNNDPRIKCLKGKLLHVYENEIADNAKTPLLEVLSNRDISAERLSYLLKDYGCSVSATTIKEYRRAVEHKQANTN